MTDVQIVIGFLLRHGLRVSEVLRMRHEDILDGQRVFIFGSKSSHDRIILDEELINTIRIKAGAGASGYVFRCTYSEVYYYMKKRDISEKILGKKNSRVTHAGRGRTIRRLKSEGLTDIQVRDRIGHKKLASTKHYLNDK